MRNTDIFDKDLNPLLEISSNEDLEPLVGYLSKKYSEGLTSHPSFKANSPNHIEYADLIAKEIRDMGGNTLSNITRGFKGPSYHEIVCDVASKLKAPYNKSNSVEQIEESIISVILLKSFEKMTEEDKKILADQYEKMGNKKFNGQFTTAMLLALFKAGGFASYQITLIIANQVAKIILGRGLMFTTNTTVARTASIFAGPIGWLITGAWTAFDISGPAYSVTIPSVIHIAMLRKKASFMECNNCGKEINSSVKFCPECGSKI